MSDAAHGPFPTRETWETGTQRLGRRVLVYERIDSTNTEALRWLGRPDSDGLALLADAQTSGRGQHGRTWTAPPRSAVLLSLLVSPPAALARPVVLTAWAAVSVCAVVEQIAGRRPQIKWPNDVLLGGKKVCGILIEQARQGDAAATVVGIGLNVTQSDEEFAAAGLPLATSLAAAGATADRDSVARQLLARLDAEYDRLLGGAVADLERRWADHLGHLGADVRLECISGRQSGRLVEVGFGTVVLEQSGGSVLVLPPEAVLHVHCGEPGQLIP